MSPVSPTTRRVLGAAFLAATVLAAFGPALGNGFVDYDDDQYVTANPRVLDGLSGSGLRWALTTLHASNWHPLTWLSHMLDVSAWGLEPRGHHLTSVLLHAASAIVLFLLLERATGAASRSLFAATLFAVHPLHVESVAWIAERKDVLSTLFWFLAIAAWFAWTRTPGKARYAAVVALAALALASKPMAVTLPLTLLVLDYWPLGRVGADGLGLDVAAIEKFPLVALSAASAAVTIAAQHAGRSIARLATIPLGDRVANAIVSSVDYLGATVLPRDLAVFYPHPGGTIPGWAVAASAAVLVVVTTAAVLDRRRRPYLLAGWLWYGITLLPVIGLVQVGEQARADRYTYVPLVGIFVMIAWGGADARRAVAGKLAGASRGSRLAAAVAPPVLAAIVLVPVTRAQVAVWHDTRTLFEHAIAATGDNATAQVNLGIYLGRQGRLEEAEKHLREAVRIAPEDVSARNNLGTALFSRGQVGAAIEQYRQAVALDQRSSPSRTNLGYALLRSGRAKAAVAELRKAVAVGPDFAPAHARLGEALSAEGRFKDAIPLLERAASLDPRDASILVSWADALAADGRREEATARYNEALTMNPHAPAAWFGLAANLAASGDRTGALRTIGLARRQGFEPPLSLVKTLSPETASGR